jgi:hypothetical protein
MASALRILAVIALLGVMSCSNSTTGSSGSSTGSVDPNVIVNSSFNSDLSGWTEIKGGANTGVVCLSNDISNTNDGTMAAYIRADYVASSSIEGIAQFVPYVANKTYVLSADLLDVPGYAKYMLIELCDTSSNSLATRYTNMFKSFGWTGWINKVLTLSPTNMAGFIKIHFYVSADNSTVDMFIDNVVLTNY